MTSFLAAPLDASLRLPSDSGAGLALPSTAKAPARKRAPPPVLSMAIKGSNAPVTSPGQTEQSCSPPPSMLVFSGGTAFNGVVEELKKFTTHVTHVLPVSDDGGSTAEIVRVLGGPAVGDIRSRCVRLADESSVEALAVKRLLGHRLPLDPVHAKAEWYTIVEGENHLWEGVSGPYRETIRAFLVYFQNQILCRSNEHFCFSNGSIGNFFFAGARIFFQSLEAAIFLFSRVSQIPIDSYVLPVICTNDRLTLGCELQNDSIIRGQNQISHPLVSEYPGEFSHCVNKVFPAVNPTVLEHLSRVQAIVYGMGSLFTSICPSLVLHGVGEIIARQCCLKILILNATHDRETFGMSASDFVVSICNTLNRKHSDPRKTLNFPATMYINYIIVPSGGSIEVDTKALLSLGINRVISVKIMHDEKDRPIYEPKALIQALKQIIISP
ncbi:hypothetical protein KP509_25G073700 [Ceratopteris richardii]|uniref:Maternal effect embryo arrest 18 n=1 Tax=Ceratopteris richardii TaxID=49495 RepID=A0A8T2RSG5_CERRI|nr:hypothetical protein KP509_25G073700 [Ceratopteris richardii]